MEMILKILFFLLSNVDIQFTEIERLIWRNHTAATALSTIIKMEFLDKRKFASAALGKETETFVVYITALPVSSIYTSRKAQMGALIAKKALIEV